VGCADAAVESSYPDDAESMTEDGDSLMMASDVLAASSDDRSVASYTHGAASPLLSNIHCRCSRASDTHHHHH